MRGVDAFTQRYNPLRYSSAEEVRSERIRWALDFWRSKRNGDCLPLRAQIDPVDMPRLLPHLILVEIVDGRLRYRLAGTQVVANAGFDFTGRHLDDLQFANRDFYLACYSDIMKTRAPLFGVDHWLYPDGRNGECEFAMLPLSSDGETVSHFLTVEDNAALES